VEEARLSSVCILSLTCYRRGERIHERANRLSANAPVLDLNSQSSSEYASRERQARYAK
jgi:hypothetical protein